MRRSVISGLLLLVACLSAGVCVKAASVDELKERATQGDTAAQLNLGMMYSRGLGVPEDKTEAAKWLRMATERGSAEAKTELDRVVPQEHRVLHIVSARYGKNGNTCDASSNVRALCEGKLDCRVQAQNGLCGDPAYGMTKDLVVEYSCDQGQSKREQAAEGLYVIPSCSTQSNVVNAAKAPSVGAAVERSPSHVEPLRVGGATPKPTEDRIVKQEQAVAQPTSASTPQMTTMGSIPAGDSTLDIQTNPPGAAFSVFSGYTFLFSGVTPFRSAAFRAGQYNICFEMQGYELFWRAAGIYGPTPPFTASLRALDPQKTTMSCIDANRLAQVDEAEDAREAVEKAKREEEWKKQEAESIVCVTQGVTFGGMVIPGGAGAISGGSVVYYRICRDKRNGRIISQTRE
jgi:hypothetical protein